MLGPTSSKITSWTFQLRLCFPRGLKTYLFRVGVRVQNSFIWEEWGEMCSEVQADVLLIRKWSMSQKAGSMLSVWLLQAPFESIFLMNILVARFYTENSHWRAAKDTFSVLSVARQKGFSRKKRAWTWEGSKETVTKVHDPPKWQCLHQTQYFPQSNSYKAAKQTRQRNLPLSKYLNCDVDIFFLSVWLAGKIS